MPTYEYYCKKCDAQFEIFQSIPENIEEPPTHCPKCDPEITQEGTLTKYFGNCRPAFNLKGDGFFSPGWK